ncbi:MAG: MAPEG family protein [Sneathiella sp.]|nr:MAPEG family protein [Sneathiella sp.]
MILKIMGQGWMTVYRRMKSDAGLASPEDLQAGLINRNPRPERLEVNDYVGRSRRMHRNDLENVPAFLIAGLLFVAVDPNLLFAQSLFYGFAVARLPHAIAYAAKGSHEMSATFYTIGSVIVIYMAGHVIFVVISRGFG